MFGRERADDDDLILGSHRLMATRLVSVTKKKFVTFSPPCGPGAPDASHLDDRPLLAARGPQLGHPLPCRAWRFVSEQSRSGRHRYGSSAQALAAALFEAGWQHPDEGGISFHATQYAKIIT
jgi:hypothetical protein